MQQRTILVVDDEQLIRESLVRLVQTRGYRCIGAKDALEARARLADEDFDLVLCDIQMPGPSGLELLRQIAEELPHTASVMVTGIDDPEVAREALELGAFGYVVKPFRPNEIFIQIMNALRRLDLEEDARRQHPEVASKVLERNVSLRRAIQQFEEHGTSDLPWYETIDRLSDALALRDEETGRHIERVGLICEVLAGDLAVDPWTAEEIGRASMLHDVGKLGISDSILQRPGQLDTQEREIIKRHAEMGHQILSGSSAPLLELAATIALCHHERWDGSGYPRGLKGEEIPIAGRVTAVADVFDALTSDRVYRRAMPVDVAQEEIRRGSGTQFDPSVVDSFFRKLDDILSIRETHPDPRLDATGRISVLVVEDQELFAIAIARLLDSQEDIAVIDKVSTAAAAEAAVRETPVDVVLMDWELPDGTGGDAARKIRALDPSTKVVILSGFANESLLAAAIEAGCSAVLSKTIPLADLMDAIRSAYAGEVTIPLGRLSSVVTRLKRPSTRSSDVLSRRELEVLRLLADGLSNAAIAERLVLSVNTVRNHVQRVIMKLGAHSKLEAVALALRQGIIEIKNPRSA